METSEIAQHLVNRTDLTDTNRAREIMAAFLSTLGERITKEEQKDFASQLPQDLEKIVLENTSAESFDLEEFYNRFASRCDLNLEDAIKYAPHCGFVTGAALTKGEMDDIIDQLPDEYQELIP